MGGCDWPMRIRVAPMSETQVFYREVARWPATCCHHAREAKAAKIVRVWIDLSIFQTAAAKAVVAGDGD